MTNKSEDSKNVASSKSNSPEKPSIFQRFPFSKTFAILGSFVVGFYLIYTSTTRDRIRRDPAAIRKTFDISNLRGQSLETAAKEKIMSGIQVAKQPWGLEMELGHFVFNNEENIETNACNEYDKVVLVFEGAGGGVNGEPAKMTVETNCSASHDLTKIEAIRIPLNFVYSEKPEDTEIDLRENYKVQIKLLNIPDEWPHQWNLVEIRLSRADNSGQSLFVSRNEIQTYLGHPLIVSY